MIFWIVLFAITACGGIVSDPGVEHAYSVDGGAPPDASRRQIRDTPIPAAPVAPVQASTAARPLH